MSGFPMKKRQAIIDGYLAATGSNLFVPAEFIDWLSGQPEHEAYDWFFGISNEAAAREYRIGLARQMASGLRITAQVQSAPAARSKVSVEVREYPAMVSPIDGRKSGGGYVPFDPSDPALSAELKRQAASALKAWLQRYRGVAEQSGINLKPIEKIAGALDSSGVVEAA